MGYPGAKGSAPGCGLSSTASPLRWPMLRGLNLALGFGCGVFRHESAHANQRRGVFRNRGFVPLAAKGASGLRLSSANPHPGADPVDTASHPPALLRPFRCLTAFSNRGFVPVGLRRAVFFTGWVGRVCLGRLGSGALSRDRCAADGVGRSGGMRAALGGAIGFCRGAFAIGSCRWRGALLAPL